MTDWTTVADIRRRARRRWDDGSWHAAYVAGEQCPVLDVPLRGPAARAIGADLARVRSWQDELVAGSAGGRAFDLAWRDVGGRAIGRMRLPDRAVLSEYAQVWRLLGFAGDVRLLDEVIATTRDRRPELLAWVGQRAQTAIALADQWPALLAALDWIVTFAGSGRHLREVSVPGVDTKFIEGHQKVLDELLRMTLASSADEGAAKPSVTRSFARRWGFAEPERLVHLRLDPALGALPEGISEVALPLRQAGALTTDPDRVLVVENQVTFLSVPVPARGAVVWGHGFDALRLGHVPWIEAASVVRYWGDIDTHGFAILHGLRTQVPSVRSVLMDRATLVAHEERWGTEPRPTRAALDALDPAEHALYTDLVEGSFGPTVRLEQERIDWQYALRALDTDR